MLRFVETVEEAYGVDLDYVIDFIEYCCKRKAAKSLWPQMAGEWIQRYGARVSAADLYDASIKYYPQYCAVKAGS